MSEFIVSDSDEDSDRQNEEDIGSEEDGHQVSSEIDSASDFRTPSCPPSRSEASLTPYSTSRTPLHFWSSPVAGPPNCTMTAPVKGVGNRRPLAEQNASLYTPGLGVYTTQITHVHISLVPILVYPWLGMCMCSLLLIPRIYIFCSS